MSLGIFNARYEISVTAYNEEDAVRLEGGISKRGKSDNITLNILYLHTLNLRETRDQKGQRLKQDEFTFQVSSKELSDKSFTIKVGQTHIIKDGYDYRVIEVKDYTMYRFTQAMQCKAVRKINIA